jgi:parvulin-like peptidyl-prolyl isomerase
MKKKSYKKQIKKKKKVKKSRGKMLYWFFGLGMMILIVLGILFAVIFYFDLTNSSLMKSVFRQVPLPIVKVDTDNITSAHLIQDTRAVQKFYQSNNYSQQKMRVDFSTKQGKMRLQIKEKNILNKLVEDIMVKKLARERGLVVNTAEVDKAVQESLRKSGSTYEQLVLNLKESYGWSVDDFKNKVVKKQLYLDKLFKWYEGASKNTITYKKAESIKGMIKSDGSNFNELAGRFSEGNSAKQEGELNWMKGSQIIPEVAVVIKKMEPGEISDIIISPLGLHIVKLEERRKIKSKGNSLVEEEFRLRQIFLKGTSFVDWLENEKQKISVKVFWKKYQWDKSKGEIIFSSENMRQIEKEIRIKSQGDPSL